MDNLSTHFHDDFCQTVAQLSDVPYIPLKTGAQRRQWLQSEHKRIVVHFMPFHASWLNMIEIWFGILHRKCLKYDHLSVEQLCQDIVAFIESQNHYFAHPFTWSYTGDGLHAKAVRRFCRLLAIQTAQMDGKFLKSQLLLMSNIADHYIHLIPSQDWLQLLQLAKDKDPYITNIIEADSKPRRQKTIRKAHAQFVETVLNRKEPPGKSKLIGLLSSGNLKLPKSRTEPLRRCNSPRSSPIAKSRNSQVRTGNFLPIRLTQHDTTPNSAHAAPSKRAMPGRTPWACGADNAWWTRPPQRCPCQKNLLHSTRGHQ